MMRDFVVWGVPRSKARVRHVRLKKPVWRNGKLVRDLTYTPRATRDAERAVRDAWAAQLGEVGPIDGPVGITVEFVYGPNARTHVQVYPLDKGAWSVGHADADNLVKLVADALVGLAFGNDRQVALLVVSKLEESHARGRQGEGGRDAHGHLRAERRTETGRTRRRSRG